jgi:hypothetical protein
MGTAFARFHDVSAADDLDIVEDQCLFIHDSSSPDCEIVQRQPIFNFALCN